VDSQRYASQPNRLLRWWKHLSWTALFAIDAINVSHHPTRTIAGPLHADSIYSKNFGTEKKPEYRIRKELHKLSPKEIQGDQIVEPSVRPAVQRIGRGSARQTNMGNGKLC
jgi:CRISPR-associated endonuclease Csn1